MSIHIDLNCDMGESFGAWTMGHDQEVIPWVSSVNIACGFHAGDPATMRRTVALALEHGVRIGAHPGLPDLLGFGRRVMAISPQEAYDLVVVQVGALAAVARSQGAALHHVKAHGALYNMAARDAALAQAIARAVADVDSGLVLYALAGSLQVQAGLDAGLAVAHEVFADRSYQPDGSLTPRQQPGAMITDVEQSVRQVLQMVEHRQVTCLSGETIALQADTLCLHGDQPGAAEFARRLYQAFEERGISVRAV